MTSAVEVVVSPISQIQYPAKRYLAPIPLSLFGELEEENNNNDKKSSLDAEQSFPPHNAPAPSTSLADLVRGKEEDEFGDFEDEFGDFESVPAGSSISTAENISEPSTRQKLILQRVRAPLADIEKNPSGVTRDFLADFGAMALPQTTDPAAPASRAVVEEDLFGNFEAVVSVPQSEVSQANRPINDFFGSFESPAIPQPRDDVTEKRPDEGVNLFADFVSVSVSEVRQPESSSSGRGFVGDKSEGFLPAAENIVQIEPAAGKTTAVSLLEDFGSNTFFDVPKRGTMSEFDDLFGDYKAPPPLNAHSSLSFSDETSKSSLGSERRNIVEHSGYDPLGVFDFSFAEKEPDVHEVVIFSPKAQANPQENGGVSDDEWGDFVAPPPPVTLTSVQREESSAVDSFTVSSADFFVKGDLGNFGWAASHEGTTQGSNVTDSWEAELLNTRPAKSNSQDGEVVSLELEKISQISKPPAPVKVDASSFYEAQVSLFFPTSSSPEPQKKKDSRRSRSVDLDALYANPNPVVKSNSRERSYVEKSAAPLSLSIFGEEEDASTETAELTLGSSLNGYVGSGRQHAVDSLDEFAESSSSDSQDENDVDADEFFLAKADDLHKLTLWLLEEGRVQEALACTAHTKALMEFQALQEDCSRALESGDLEKASIITSNIEAAHAKLAKPQEWHKWQRRQRHENGFKHGSSPIVTKLTYEDMMSLLGGLSDPRGVYFRDHFQSNEIDSLAKKDLRAAAEHHTRALETFHLLISATVEEQLLYVKAWSALASSCASELELGMIFWQRAVEAQAQSHLLTHRKGRNYFAALGQVYCVYLILDATARLHASWLEVAGEKGKAIHRLMDQCRSCWNGSGLKDAVYWALSEANDSLASTNISWQAILELSIAVNLASLKHPKSGEQPVCGLSLLTLQTLPGVATVEWGGRHYFQPLANMWANCVESEPPRLPVLELQQTD